MKLITSNCDERFCSVTKRNYSWSEATPFVVNSRSRCWLWIGNVMTSVAVPAAIGYHSFGSLSPQVNQPWPTAISSFGRLETKQICIFTWIWQHMRRYVWPRIRLQSLGITFQYRKDRSQMSENVPKNEWLHIDSRPPRITFQHRKDVHKWIGIFPKTYDCAWLPYQRRSKNI